LRKAEYQAPTAETIAAIAAAMLAWMELPEQKVQQLLSSEQVWMEGEAPILLLLTARYGVRMATGDGRGA
jgi:hypothetical protein